MTGLDKAYNEKELLSNAIQALQTQMRADRKSEAGQIYAKMFKDAGNNTKIITPIAEYTLPMALSDADAYYQAGTIASAFIGLSKTVANAEQNADTAKANVGPNPAAVSNVVATATPVALASVSRPTLVISQPSVDTSYRGLRAQLFPGGSSTPDPVIVAYVRDILGQPPIAIGVILNDPRQMGLRQKISGCIIARSAGQPCASGSLAQFR